MHWSSQTVLVTGASGFIGSQLTERLVRSGAQVRALAHYNSRNDWGLLELLSNDVRDQVEILSGDLRDSTFVHHAVKGCQVVFHLGALIAIPYSYQAPRQYVDTNVVGTLNILQAALDSNVTKVVHTSTSETYGTAVYTPIDESHPLQGQSPYSASKIGADKLAESFYCSFALPVATVRPFNTFGPRQSARAIIPTIISQALSSDTIKLGLLTPVRDLTFVEDTISGFVKVAESERSIGEVINLGTGRGVTMGELAETIIKMFDTEKHIVSDEERMRPEKSEVMALICDNTKAQELLGWEPEYTLEQGLSRTIDYVRDNLDRYKPAIFNR